jgi:hypothetical protein
MLVENSKENKQGIELNKILDGLALMSFGELLNKTPIRK